MRCAGLLLMLLFAVLYPPVEAISSGPVNGGFADAGLLGEYFANTNFDGSPRFVRRDVRVDFDWEGLSPGGAPQQRFRSFPADAFSIRWTGRILPRVAGVYRFATFSDDDMRVRIRSSGAPEWGNAIESRPEPRRPASRMEGIYRFDRAGVPYDIQIEYRHRGVVAGVPKPRAVARLTWTAPGLPDWEVVDAVSGFAIDVNSEAFADVVKARSDSAPWRQLSASGLPAAIDNRGWPTVDAGFQVWEGGFGRNGVYSVQFSGHADLSVSPPLSGRITSAFYNAETNLTTATLEVPALDSGRYGPTMLIFRRSRRSPGTIGPAGIVGLRILRPLLPGSDTPSPPEEVFTGGYAEQVARFAIVRFPHPVGANTVNDAIMLANQTGKDLSITLPAKMNGSDVEALARRLRYGSPDSPSSDTLVPSSRNAPLSPNLRLYIERTVDPTETVPPGDSDLAYDGETDSEVARWRLQARRTRETHDAFAAIFGTDMLIDRVRMILRCPNKAMSGKSALEWEMEYLDRTKAGTAPRPICDFLWGVGQINDPVPTIGADSSVSGPLIPGGLTGFVRANGTLTKSFSLPARQQSDVYAIRFRAIQRRRPDRLDVDHESFDVRVDGKSIVDSPMQIAGTPVYQPGASAATFETLTFSGAIGSTHTLAFVGHSPALPPGVVGPPQDSAEIEGVELLSGDAIFAHSHLDKATQADRARCAVLARQYGLHPVFGDIDWQSFWNLASPIEVATHLGDARVMLEAQKEFETSAIFGGGGPMPALMIFGPNPPWVHIDDAGAEAYPRAIDAANGLIPSESNIAFVPRSGAGAEAPYFDLSLPDQTGIPSATTSAGAPSAAMGADRCLLWEIRLTEAESLKFSIGTDEPGVRLTVDGRAPLDRAETYGIGTHVIRVAASEGTSLEAVRGVRVIFAGIAAPTVPHDSPATATEETH